jgi:20S proteasome alpha/beta subunit
MENNKFLRPKNKDRYRKRRPEPLTCIIGARCKDGVIIAGDRRVLRGTEYSEEKKILQPIPTWNFIVGASGISGLMDKFLYEMRVFLASRGSQGIDWRTFLYALEDIAYMLHQRYEPRLQPAEMEIEPYYFEVLSGCKEYSEHATLYHMYRTGFSTEVKRFDVIGHGQPHALPFLKTLYHPSITMDEMIKLCVFILKLIDEEKIDLSVGGKPQIFKIPDIGDAIELSENEIDDLLKNVASPKEKLEKAIFS